MGKHLAELWENLPTPLRVLGWAAALSLAWWLMSLSGLVEQ